MVEGGDPVNRKVKLLIFIVAIGIAVVYVWGALAQLTLR